MIGNKLFWYLETERKMNPDCIERYTVIMEEYLAFAPSHAKEVTTILFFVSYKLFLSLCVYVCVCVCV